MPHFVMDWVQTEDGTIRFTSADTGIIFSIVDSEGTFVLKSSPDDIPDEVAEPTPYGCLWLMTRAEEIDNEYEEESESDDG